jgi:hypothetical protein
MKHAREGDSPLFWIIALVVLVLMSGRFWLLVILLAALWVAHTGAGAFLLSVGVLPRPGLLADGARCRCARARAGRDAAGWRLHDGIVIPFAETGRRRLAASMCAASAAGFWGR